jgi:hypothetical protein
MTFQRLAPKLPDLQTGDLVWPRADRQIVRFDAQSPEWQQAYAVLTSEPAQLTAEQIDLLDEFLRINWVGHVALIEIIDGTPWVVDATTHRSIWHKPPDQGNQNGVGSQSYENFLNDESHLQSHIWHGRLKPQFVSHIPNFGQDLVDAAKKHFGAPYTLLPGGLENPDKFYCSKLIWHALRDGLDITLQKKPDALPMPWFTPWDVMQADCIELLYEPPGRKYVE